MAEFKVGRMIKDRDDDHASFDIDQPSERWIGRIRVYGSEALRNHIVNLLNDNPLQPPEPEQVVRWAVLFSDGVVQLFKTLDSAKGWCGSVAVSPVVLTPGRFDDENTPSEWDQAIDAARRAILREVDHSPDARKCYDVVRALKREGK